jgi:hypothetical protein
MSMHRRWLFTTTGQAILASAVGSLLRAREASAQPCPPPPPGVKPSTDLPTVMEDLKDCFYGGVDIPGFNGKQWGLNGPNLPTPGSHAALDSTKQILPGPLKAHYEERLKKVLGTTAFADSYALLREQTAVLGTLTRCMRENDTSPGPIHEKHLNWAREALGFALNSKLRACLVKTCHFPIPIKGDQRAELLKPQLDQPCPLC